MVMKKLVRGILIGCSMIIIQSGVFCATEVKAEDTKEALPSVEGLYATSAVLMDGDSGRILYEKAGNEAKPMASTTKIMTCIIALEQGDLTEVVTVSKNAATQPKVHLGMQTGETFYLKDLLHSLMLESHNDSAVAIAEHIGGSVDGFADMMNQKAKELGLSQTYFITPNGLDACDETGAHATTAAELARIMRYCIKESPQKEEFLAVTRQASYPFMDVTGKRSFSCYNHNAFLTMMDGALTGKTGFTGDAGYCYVGAVEKDGRTFIVALLACGWPNNKGYKWSDTKKLMNYGIDNYTYQDVFENKELPKLPVDHGIPKSQDISEEASTGTVLDMQGQKKSLQVLLNKEEQVTIQVDLPKELKAPIKRGEPVGEMIYLLDGKKLKTYPIIAEKNVDVITWKWCFERVLKKVLVGIPI